MNDELNLRTRFRRQLPHRITCCVIQVISSVMPHTRGSCSTAVRDHILETNSRFAANRHYFR